MDSEKPKEQRAVVLDLTPGEIETFIYEKRRISVVDDAPTQEYLHCSEELKAIRQRIMELERERVDVTARLEPVNHKLAEIEDKLSNKRNIEFQK
jgi:hypothetical protein